MNLWLIVGATGGALVTYISQKYLGLSPVISSSLVGLAGAGIAAITHNSLIAPAVFCGSFVGMTTSTVLPLPLIGLAGVFSGIVFQNVVNIFPGFGGKLGATAFISVMLVVGGLNMAQKLFSR